ncbi:MAG: CatB-related O-acetyltransferase [Methanomassiliicoccales archaeon]|jgi:acetyltransferase-like isoleucine patch superfamily enzyme
MKFTKDNPNYKKYVIGDFTYGTPAVYEWPNSGSLSIGKFCSIAPNVNILLGGNHRPDWVTTYPFSDFKGLHQFKGHPSSKGDVIIGSDVWIGMGANILSGVTIGHGAVVGLGAVVSRSIAPYTIVVGNPSKEVRKRFTDDQIVELLKISWWNWTYDKIKENLPLMLTDNISGFIEKHRIST